MKKLIIALGLMFLITGTLWAQNDDGAKMVTVTQAIQNKNYGITMQVGIPYMVQNLATQTQPANPFDIRFPWDVLYLFPTFTEDDFDVSKGYFGDKILITWDLRANFDLISSIKIFKREYTEAGTNAYDFVGSVSPSETSYEDKYAEGGILYEYKVVADGISEIEILYSTYITGIGYRSPTAIVTGNVSYKGGNPVKDVIVRASSDGSSVNAGSSLNIKGAASVKVEGLSTPITDAVTFQAWLKPRNIFTSDNENDIKLFSMSTLDNLNSINVTVNFLEDSKILEVNIGNRLFKLHNYFPSGKLNSRGDDILIPITEFNSQFVHFSVLMRHGFAPALYINGRVITDAYKNEVNEKLIGVDANYSTPYFNVTVPTQNNVLRIGGNLTEWTNLYIGGAHNSYIDEIRVWNAPLEAATIRTDYTRYISGNDKRLVTYLRANERVGSYVYDLSRDGFNYNKNHGKLWEETTPVADKVVWASNTGSFPTADQLGILGVTDINGNYEITAIPYSGTGESFNITPLFGVHQFEPGQQLVFLGQGSEVVNKVDFIDISSFSFKGKILFDTRGVFKSLVQTTAVGDLTGDETIAKNQVLPNEGYNYWETISDGKISKGEYWYNEEEDRYDKYATIYSQNVNVYVDGNIVLDENNAPVVSDANGYFDIQVPIGNHYISVKKDGHEYNYNGRFPATPEEGSTNSGLFEFFEDSNEAVIFVDNTRVTVVGKVVGGSVEAAKSIGFGDQGLFQKDVDINGETEKLTISSINNIGVADLVLGYIPPGSGPTATSQRETEFNFETNTETGEFRVSVMPLKYEINEQSGLSIRNNSDIIILEATETVNLSTVPDLIETAFEYPDGTFEIGEPYHYEKSFTYRTTPVLSILEQTSDQEIDIDGVKYSTAGFKLDDNTPIPIYTQFANYKIRLQSFERYVNKDSGVDVESIVPIIDGEFKPNNNLAFEGSETVERDPNDNSVVIYKFKGGMPSISPPFVRTLNLEYRINDIDYEAENYLKEGIILGGQSDGSQTFITAAPDIPEIILRDPPGSNSSASIQKGESITFTESSDLQVQGGFSTTFKFFKGITIATGGSITGPLVKVSTTNDLETGISTTASSNDGKSVTKTYNFNQTISTSDSPEYVGAEGDLYIGQSKNYFYGSFDYVQSSSERVGNSPFLELVNDNGDNVFISKQKAMYFNEEPSETFFVLSQKRILESVIPELKLIIENLDNGIISKDDDGVIDKEYYEQQINLWRKTIYENERSKYRALNDRVALKNEVEAAIDSFQFDVESSIDSSEEAGQLELLNNTLNFSNGLKDLINENFAQNISFDAGVGEITRNVESIVIQEKSTNVNVKVSQTLATVLGAAVNDFGLQVRASAFSNQELNSGLSEAQTSTVNISYTLKDNDPANALSVDIVNLFDGNGPVFSTIGGTTSCPYEGPELSYFYSNADYDPDATSFPELAEDKREPLSYATQKAELPMISVDGAIDVSNVPESRNAEFKLIFENLADFNSDAASFNYFELIIDNTTNPNNALINVAQNGRVVYIPYGEQVEYTLTLGKSISDVYDYENIRVVLQSRCDPVNVYSEVFLSAHFVPSCSNVEVTAPLTNWVYNKRSAFNVDESVNPLQIKLASFDTSFNSFKKLDLEYRIAASPTWTRLQTYYTNQAYYDEAVAANETEIDLIESAELTYALDVVGLQLSDGNYELRARSTCTNDTEYISDVVTGRVDLTSPQKFGTPLPIDGILGIGEDLKVSFNEPIFFNSAISTIEIKGQTNQLPINHNVSLYFEGATNTAVINKPKITSGDFTLEFWMNNSTVSGAADIIQQDGGLNIRLNNGEVFFTLGGITAQGGIVNDGLFHHYTFTHKNSTGEISIYQDDAEIGGNTGTPNVDFTNNNPLVIGGNSFIGNLNELRLWNKTIGLENAYAKMYDKLIGNEPNLVGYWPMDEGRGEIAKDLARFKHAQVNTAWDIKPKGNSYQFNNGQYLALDNVGFVQLTNEMDATISFWIKTETAQNATLFSNGKGDGSDIIQPNGHANKWAINMTSSGMLTFQSEGNSYMLTNQSVADNNWHHITLLFNRIGSLRTYVDAAPVTSNLMTDIGGLSGNKIWIGARGSSDLAGNETVDNEFTGKIDEFRLWNTLRNVEQISRDRFNEVDVESIGLVLYAKMNAPDPENGNGPLYFHADVNETIAASLAVLNTGEVNYADDVPSIKPERELLKFEVNKVINGDQMILEPVVTDWASLEGQILDITVHSMFDSANNRQQSPITWTAYVKRNEVSWFAEGYNEIVDVVKSVGEEKSFEISIVNKGGNGQPFTINNVPSWLKLSSTSGTLQPDSKIVLTARIDKELTPGEYLENLYLQTDFGFDEKMQIKVRVLAQEPDWNVNPTDFDFSMNIVGRVKIEGKFSEDSYDKIAAFSNGEVRGSAYLIYNEAFKEYFAYLTVFSNNVFGETIVFSIWDASQGKIIEAEIDGTSSTIFKENEVVGSLSNPVIFENSDILVQEIELNKGWTWISFNVNDSNFANLNTLTQNLNLETDDRMLSHSPSQLETYYKDYSVASNSTWSGTISGNGGMSVAKMYKVKFANAQTLNIKGNKVDISNWSFPMKQNWNWLPYPLGGNQATNEALAYFDAADGDVVKSQNLFAIYDPINGWNGTLNYMEASKGYMIKSSKVQTFTYPNYLNNSTSSKSNTIVNESQDEIAAEFKKYSNNMNAVVQLPEGFDSLFVYDTNGNLKGKANNQTVGDTKLSFITIYGDVSEILVFYVGDGRDEQATSKTFNFKSNNVLGTIAKPIVLEVFSDNISVFPNPFEDNLTVEVDVFESETVTIQLYNLTSQLLFSKEFEVNAGANLLKISPKVATGIYLLQVKMKENTVITKVVKK